MIEDRRVLGLITARGGSVRLPGKNVMPLGGKPLIAWTVEAARGSRYVDRVVLSTDDGQIADAARAAGCDVPFVRPERLATASASSVDVALHTLDALDETYDLLVLLQPTSPLRQAIDIDACLEWHLAGGGRAVASVSPLTKAANTIGQLDRDKGEFRRLFPEAGSDAQLHALNGAVYVVGVADFRKTRAFLPPAFLSYVMPAERSIDIDTAFDFLIAEALVAAS